MTAMRERVNTEPVTLESVLATENLNAAWSQVKTNDGAAGVDGWDVERSLPRIRERWTQLAAECRQNATPLVVEIPLLFETGAERFFDRIVTVACSHETQLARTAARAAAGAGRAAAGDDDDEEDDQENGDNSAHIET